MAVSDRKSEQVYRWLLAYIDENKFSNNQKLPSENALCRRLNVSRETVRVAMDLLVQEELIYRVKGSGTYFHKDQALSRELSDENAKWKIGLILQGQDPNANSKLIDGVRSVLVEQRVDLHIFLTDNKFSNERRCLQTVVHQNFQGFIVDGVKASIMNPNLDCYQELYRRRIPVIFYNNYYKNLRFPKVIVNDMECAEQLVGHLL
ncbi:MAG: GntR family transcriptional regulator, partial [Oscillospiraceae bacterium]|nr:GntR family transcriptional regulator [Oscillospiraceae bacterium]